MPVYLLIGLPVKAVWWCLSAAVSTTATTTVALAGTHGTVASGAGHTEAVVGISKTFSMSPPSNGVDDDDDARATDSPREGDGEPSMREHVERMLSGAAENTPPSTFTDRSHDEQEFSPPPPPPPSDEEYDRENVRRKNPKSRNMERHYDNRDRRFENARGDRYRVDRDEL